MQAVLWPLLLQVILIALNAVFACAEIAVISVNDNKLAQLVAQGDKRALRLARLTGRPATISIRDSHYPSHITLEYCDRCYPQT